TQATHVASEIVSITYQKNNSDFHVNPFSTLIPVTDCGNIIGLAEQHGMGAISIEPGGQFEISGAPLETIHETCKESNQHLA
ncbi:glutamate-cysteine ligase family protein, partial [Rhizobium ruizarguesonis]